MAGGGYSGLACGYYGLEVAHTIRIFGLEENPGEREGTCASTISAGLLHPLTPRGKVIYRGEEGFKETLGILKKIEGHTKREIVRQYPYDTNNVGIYQHIHMYLCTCISMYYTHVHIYMCIDIYLYKHI
jgi:hypothetical protein